MKKIVLTVAAAASVLAAAGPASAQSFGRHDSNVRVVQVQHDRYGNQAYGNRDFGRRVVETRRVETRRWNRGDRFDRRFATNYRVIGNPRAYRLNDAPRGYRWVQSGNDAVLVALASGLIGSIVGNAF
jgi:Ni/Co efflux regulator RcnB